MATGCAGYGGSLQIVVKMHIHGTGNVTGLETLAASLRIGEIEPAVEYAHACGIERG